MASTLLLWLVFPVLTKTETLEYDAINLAPDIVECTDASTPCVIACTGGTSCRQTEFHCHRTEPQPCTIHIDGTSVGRESFYYTHQAPIVNLIANGEFAMWQSVIYAHEAMGSKLYISAVGRRVFDSSTGSIIYAPVGEGSLLHLTCEGGLGCARMRIYDDWTTEVHIEVESMISAQIRNIFDDSPLNITRNDTIYTGLNSAYRAPVYLLKPYGSSATQTFNHVKYFGHNHGDWTLYTGTCGGHCFQLAYIEATADIPPYKNRSGYDINVTGTSTAQGIFWDFTLNATQSGANIYVQVAGHEQWNGASNAKIYAEEANSVEVHCKEGGTGFCNGLMLECPLNNACKIQCDDDVNTDCSNMKIYTNDACSRADVLCDGIRCNFGVNSSDVTRVFCGFAQNETFCEVEYNASDHLFCQNKGSGNCTNKPTEAQCEESTITSTEISSTEGIEPDLTTTMTLKEGRVNEETTQATEAPRTSQEKQQTIVVTHNETLFIVLCVLCLIIIGLVWYVIHLRKKMEEVHVNKENMKDNEAISSVVAPGEKEEEKKMQNMNVPMIADTDVDVHNMPLPPEHVVFEEEEEDEGLWDDTGNDREEKTVGCTTKDSV